MVGLVPRRPPADRPALASESTGLEYQCSGKAYCGVAPLRSAAIWRTRVQRTVQRVPLCGAAIWQTRVRRTAQGVPLRSAAIWHPHITVPYRCAVHLEVDGTYRCAYHYVVLTSHGRWYDMPRSAYHYAVLPSGGRGYGVLRNAHPCNSSHFVCNGCDAHLEA